jgi:RNA polymerase-associated protein
VRIVLAEKDIATKIESIDTNVKSEDLATLNPYNTTPTLADRDLVLYETRVILEYLDERYPHPPLMPVDPVARAHTRMVLQYIHRDLYSLVPDLNSTGAKKSSNARKKMRESLIASVELFSSKKYFLGDEFTLVDCSLAPILWRLPYYSITLPTSASVILDYIERVAERPSFQESLSEFETEIRLPDF